MNIVSTKAKKHFKRNAVMPRASHRDTAYLMTTNLKRNAVTQRASHCDTAYLLGQIQERETQ